MALILILGILGSLFIGACLIANIVLGLDAKENTQPFPGSGTLDTKSDIKPTSSADDIWLNSRNLPRGW